MSHMYIWGPNQLEDAIYQIEKLQKNIQLAIRSTSQYTQTRFEFAEQFLRIASLVARYKVQHPVQKFIPQMYQLIAPSMHQMHAEVYLDGSILDTIQLPTQVDFLKGDARGIVTECLPVAQLPAVWSDRCVSLITANLQTFKTAFSLVSSASTVSYQGISSGAFQISSMCEISWLIIKNQFGTVPLHKRAEIMELISRSLYQEYGIYVE